MINSYKELQSVIKYEKEVYAISLKSRIWGCISNHFNYKIWRWLYYSRKNDYYSLFYDKGLLGKVISLYYIRNRKDLTGKLSFDIDTNNIDKVLIIY